MVGLYDMYPEFDNRPLYMTGESYSGKYLPVFSKATLVGNQYNQTDQNRFNLKATLIGDGYPAPY